MNHGVPNHQKWQRVIKLNFIVNARRKTTKIRDMSPVKCYKRISLRTFLSHEVYVCSPVLRGLVCYKECCALLSSYSQPCDWRYHSCGVNLQCYMVLYTLFYPHTIPNSLKHFSWGRGRDPISSISSLFPIWESLSSLLRHSFS